METIDGHPLTGPLCFVMFGLGVAVLGHRLWNGRPMFELTPERVRPYTGGYEIVWSQRMLPDPPDVVVGQILDYRAKVLNR